MLEPKDYTIIVNLLPNEQDYESWDLDVFKIELEDLHNDCVEHCCTNKVKTTDIPHPDTELKEIKNQFPFYEEYINNPD